MAAKGIRRLRCIKKHKTNTTYKIYHIKTGCVKVQIIYSDKNERCLFYLVSPGNKKNPTQNHPAKNKHNKPENTLKTFKKQNNKRPHQSTTLKTPAQRYKRANKTDQFNTKTNI
jgi:hypothetical protein